MLIAAKHRRTEFIPLRHCQPLRHSTVAIPRMSHDSFTL